MKMKEIQIKNFRNFEDLTLNLNNRNVVFGLNDVGKTNFLIAIRYLLDYKQRTQEFSESDFFEKDTSKNIVIQMKFNIADEIGGKLVSQKEQDDNRKFIALMRPTDSNSKDYYIKLVYNFQIEDKLSMTFSHDGENWEEMASKGGKYTLDYLFDVIYIDSKVSLDNVFKNRAKAMFYEYNKKNSESLDTVKANIETLNDEISRLDFVKETKKEISGAFKKIKPSDEYTIEIVSEMESGTLYSNIYPYLSLGGKHYPTAGDGRKKLIAYSILGMKEVNGKDNKIKVFLIEEIENHLHKNLQLTLSKYLFGEDPYFDIFVMSTHSADVVSYMNKVELLKLNIKGVKSRSYFYKVPNDYEFIKQKLNKGLAYAIFSNKCLLVEGPSEEILFDKVLLELDKDYYEKGYSILAVNGIGFKDYKTVLDSLGVTTLIKTDNDLKFIKDANDESKCIVQHIGINRALSLCNKQAIENTSNEISKKDDDDFKVSYKATIYESNKGKIDDCKNNYVFLSKNDLENDLNEVIPCIIQQEFETVAKMQIQKQINMITLCKKLDKTKCQAIYDHVSFVCLKEFMDEYR